MSVPRIRLGLELVDDSGDEVFVADIDEAKGVVTLEMLEDDDSYTIPIRELRNGLRDGDFALLEAAEEEAEDPDDDDEDAGDGDEAGEADE